MPITPPEVNARKAIPLTAVALLGVASLGIASQQIFSVDQPQHNASDPSYHRAPSDNAVPASAFNTLLARAKVFSDYDCVNASDASANGISAVNCKQRIETGSLQDGGFMLTIFDSSDPVYSENYAGRRLSTVYDAKKRAAQRAGQDTQVPSRDDIAANLQLFSLDEFTGTCEGEGDSCARGARDFGTTMYPFRQSPAYQRLVDAQGANPRNDAERRGLDRLNELTDRLDAKGITCNAPHIENGVAYADCPNVGRLVVDVSGKNPTPAGSNVIAGGDWYLEGAKNATYRSVSAVKDLASSTAGSTSQPPRTEPGKADPVPPVPTSAPSAPSSEHTLPPAPSTTLPSVPSTSVPPLPETTIPTVPPVSTESSSSSSDTSTAVNTPTEKDSAEAQPTSSSEVPPTSEMATTPTIAPETNQVVSSPEPPVNPAPSRRPEEVNALLTSTGRPSWAHGPKV